MSTAVDLLLEPAEGCRSAEAARYLAELQEMHRKLVKAISDLSPEQLSWQAKPGMNTIGMLITHIAVSQANLSQIGLLGEAKGHVEDVVGIGPDDDGMPVPANGSPPAGLSGRDAGYFQDLLTRAQSHTEAAIRALGENGVDARFRRPAPGGGERTVNVRWVLSHMVEHLTEHRGQIQLLRALYNKRGA